MTTCIPKVGAIKQAIWEAINERHSFKDRHAMAREVFIRWRAAHDNPEKNWTHGVGKKSNSTPPDPDQSNPYGSFHRYITGSTAQNLQGWEIVANLLHKPLHEIIELAGRVVDSPITTLKPFEALISAGNLPLANLATIEVARPEPRHGANTVSADSRLKQTISLSARAIFNTIREEELCAENGDLIAVADMAVAYAYLVVRVSDQHVMVLNGVGTQGMVAFENTEISYLGTEDHLVVFEVAAKDRSKTLSGIVQNIDNLVELQGHFTESDFVGTAINKNSLRLENVRFDRDDSKMPGRHITIALKQQIILRGIDLSENECRSDERKLTARRYFMRPVIDDPEC